MKKTLVVLLITVLFFSFFPETAKAQISYPLDEVQKDMREVARQVFDEMTTITPKNALDAFKRLKSIALSYLEDRPDVAKELAKKFGINFVVSKMLNAAIDVMIEEMVERYIFEKEGIGKDVTKAWAKAAVNTLIFGPQAGLLSVYNVTFDSWEETMQAIRELPSDAPMDDELILYYSVTKSLDEIKERSKISYYINKHLTFIILIAPQAVVECAEGIIEKITGKHVELPIGWIPPKLTDISKPSDTLIETQTKSSDDAKITFTSQPPSIPVERIWNGSFIARMNSPIPRGLWWGIGNATGDKSGDTRSITLTYDNSTASFKYRTDVGSEYPNRIFYWNDSVSDAGNMWGLDMSYGSFVQFTPEKDFVRFVLKDNIPDGSWPWVPVGDTNRSRIEGYYGIRTLSLDLPTSGMSKYDIYERSVSPYTGIEYSTEYNTFGKYMVLSINWDTGKVYGIAQNGPYPLSSIDIFTGEVDRANSAIVGNYFSKTSKIGVDPADAPRFIRNSQPAYLQFYGSSVALIDGEVLPISPEHPKFYSTSAPAGIGGIFETRWYPEPNTSAKSFTSNIGFVDEPTMTPEITGYSYYPSDDEGWKGYAVGFVFNRNTGDLTVARNTDVDDVQITFKPSQGLVKGAIAVRDGASYWGISTGFSGAYVSPKAFGVVFNPIENPDVPSYFATLASNFEPYNYTTWGYWSMDDISGNTVFIASPWIAGQLTPANEVPLTGTATYTGEVRGHLLESSLVSGSFTSVNGSSSLTANFGSRTLTGNFDFNNRTDTGGPWTTANVNASWASGTNNITGNLNAANGMSGNVNGAFFGPQAAEVGGNWTLQGGGNSAAGIFRGMKQ